MADISLREYLNNLEPLLKSGASTEVVHHCRHILQYFPKNAETYRYLGQALASASNWGEAAEVYQRLLSVYPDDYTAHSGLSEAYLRLKRPDDAIWHLERAFEQDPNNQSIIEALRELYRRHRRIEQGKVQLTTGAVARQYLRNGLYEQAVDTLQGALERTPDRVDLRLLLAQTYQEAGSTIEAGESALEVLETLPDCLEANRILAQLWLSAERPSDAQRYINRVQSVAPYLALELAQGQPASDDSFKLEELDYQRVAEREILTAAPDWLQDLPPSELPTSGDDLPDWADSFAPSQPARDDDSDAIFDDDFSSGLPDDWLTDLGDAPQSVPPLQSSKRTGRTGLLSSLDLPPEPESLTAAPVEPELEFPLDNLPGTDELFSGQVDPMNNAALEMPDLFADDDLPASPVEAVQRSTGDLRDNDPLAWLKDSGVEIIEGAERGDTNFDLFGADDDNLSLKDADSANPLAWLQGYGDDMVVEQGSPQNFFPEDDELPLAAEDAADPLAWLQGSDVEIVEEAPAIPSFEAQAQEADPLDWLTDESLLDEALDVEALLESTGPLSTSEFRSVQSEALASPDTTERQEPMFDDNDNDLDWLKGDEPEQKPTDENLPDWLVDVPIDREPTPEPEMPDDEDAFAWLSEAEPTPASEMDVPDWLADASATAAPVDAQGVDSLDWMSETADESDLIEEVDDVPDWLAAASPRAEQTPSDSADSLDWMSEMDVVEADEADASADIPDWLTAAPAEALEAETMGISESSLEWISAEDDEPELAFEDDAPDWMSEVAPAASLTESGEDDFSWMGATADSGEVQSAEDDLTILEGIGPVAADALRQGGITTFEQIAAASPEELLRIVKIEQGVSLVSDTTTWPKQAQYIIDGDMQGLYAYQDYLVAGKEPDVPPQETWPEPSMSAVENDSLEWMSEVEPETDDEAGLADTGVEAMPDWLSAAAPAPAHDDDEIQFPEPAAADAGFEWMSDLNDEPAEESEEDAEAAAMPDWLSAASPITSQSITPDEPEDSSFSWGDDAEPAEESSSDMPEWLSNIQPRTEEEFEPELAAPSEFSWIEEMNAPEPEAEAGDFNIEEPEWDEAGEYEEAIVEEPTMMADLDTFEEEAELPTPANNAPDWLNAMVPGLDIDFDAPEDEPVEQEFVEPRPAEEILPVRNQREFDWLMNVVEEETQQIAAVTNGGKRRRFSFSRLPAWLRKPAEEPDQPASSGDDTDDIDLPPWLQ